MNSTKSETATLRIAPLESVRVVVAIEQPTGDKLQRLPSGLGGLPPARPPLSGKTGARYEKFCTDWFLGEKTLVDSVPRA